MHVLGWSVTKQTLLIHRLRLGAGRVFVDVNPDVDDGALAAGDALAGFFQRWADLARLAHGDAPAAEAFGKLFKIDIAQLIADAAALWTVLADLAAADLVHRRVVADHRHVGQLEALRGFHIPRGHAEGTVAVVAQHFFLRMDELGRHRERSADAQSAEWPWVHPVAGLARLHRRRGDRHHVAAVADVDRVVGQEFIDLISDAIRIDRRRFRFERRQKFFVGLGLAGAQFLHPLGALAVALRQRGRLPLARRL